jgi:hypothetical protein
MIVLLSVQFINKGSTKTWKSQTLVKYVPKIQEYSIYTAYTHNINYKHGSFLGKVNIIFTKQIDKGVEWD